MTFWAEFKFAQKVAIFVDLLGNAYQIENKNDLSFQFNLIIERGYMVAIGYYLLALSIVIIVILVGLLGFFMTGYYALSVTTTTTTIPTTSTTSTTTTSTTTPSTWGCIPRCRTYEPRYIPTRYVPTTIYGSNLRYTHRYR